MPLLLLLSAILSALTGVVGGSRPVDVQIARQAVQSDAGSLVAVAASAVSGHAHLLGGFGNMTTFAAARVLPVPTTTASRLYLDRPRA